MAWLVLWWAVFEAALFIAARVFIWKRAPNVGRRRSPIVLLANYFLGPGAGHFCLGWWKRGVAFVFGSWLAVLLMYTGFEFIRADVWCLALPLAIMMLWRLVSLGDLVRLILTSTEEAAPPTPRLRSWLPAAIATPIVLVGVTMLLRFVSVEGFYVPTDSMADTISAGDRILVDKLLGGPPEHGDLALFYVEDLDNLVHVKRIIALPGDTVEIRDGAPWVNGKKLDEPYVKTGEDRRRDKENTPSVTVTEGRMYVLGDFRAHSFDSRNYGLVDFASIIGYPLMIYDSTVPEQPVRARFRPPGKDDKAPGAVRWSRIGRQLR